MKLNKIHMMIISGILLILLLVGIGFFMMSFSEPIPSALNYRPDPNPRPGLDPNNLPAYFYYKSALTQDELGAIESIVTRMNEAPDFKTMITEFAQKQSMCESGNIDDNVDSWLTCGLGTIIDKNQFFQAYIDAEIDKLLVKKTMAGLPKEVKAFFVTQYCEGSESCKEKLDQLRDPSTLPDSVFCNRTECNKILFVIKNAQESNPQTYEATGQLVSMVSNDLINELIDKAISIPLIEQTKALRATQVIQTVLDVSTQTTR